jgi:RNase P/RNase MRP subunit POP5
MEKQKKVKPFSPTLKEKVRYLLIQGDSEKFKEILLNFLGVEGFSKLNFRVLSEIKFKEKDFSLVKVNASELIKIRGALCVFENEIKIVKIYGTIKKAKKQKLMRENYFM